MQKLIISVILCVLTTFAVSEYFEEQVEFYYSIMNRGSLWNQEYKSKDPFFLDTDDIAYEFHSINSKLKYKIGFKKWDFLDYTLALGIDAFLLTKYNSDAEYYLSDRITKKELDGNYSGLSLYTEYLLADNVQSKLIYSLINQSFKKNDDTPVNYILPKNNTIQAINLLVHNINPLSKKEENYNSIEIEYRKADSSRKYGLNHSLNQFDKIFWFTGKTFFEKKKKQQTLLMGIAFLYSKYSPLLIGNPLMLVDKYHCVLYGIPENEISLYQGIYGKIGWKEKNLINTPLEVFINNSVLIYSSKLAYGFEVGIDAPIIVPVMGRLDLIFSYAGGTNNILNDIKINNQQLTINLYMGFAM